MNRHLTFEDKNKLADRVPDQEILCKLDSSIKRVLEEGIPVE
jgi:hypothetical protein